MYARRIFAAAAIVIATASGAACDGNSPTASSNLTDSGTPQLPDVPPTDTTGFVPPPMFP
ncbi:hypothetical protein [Longimicrobium sp.]|uniref:hypothetical protein n=1 Tax=Longimicrobium sp. TaxID=2029185 RepID=UPI003B3A70F5